MAHPYTTEERVRRLLGPARCTTLLDRDSDGSEDTGDVSTANVDLIDDAIERACNRIDSSLGDRYVMPCASIVDPTPTPGAVADLCDIGVAMLLYEWLAPSAKDAETFRNRFEGKDGTGGMLAGYANGDLVATGLTLITDTSTVRRPLTYESAGPTFSGRTDDDYTSTGTDRTHGFF